MLAMGDPAVRRRSSTAAPDCAETDLSALRERLGLDRALSVALTGERRLQMAMVEAAIWDVLAPDKRATPRDIRGALAWMARGYNSSIHPDVKTFEGCCESVGLDPDAVRRAVAEMRARSLRPTGQRVFAVGDAKRRGRRIGSRSGL